jgi:hypothetical protein
MTSWGAASIATGEQLAAYLTCVWVSVLGLLLQRGCLMLVGVWKNVVLPPGQRDLTHTLVDAAPAALVIQRREEDSRPSAECMTAGNAIHPVVIIMAADPRTCHTLHH